jgi:hypothetical protein
VLPCRYSLFSAVVAWANFKQQRWQYGTKPDILLPSDLARPGFDPRVAVHDSTHLRAQIGCSTHCIFDGVVAQEMELYHEGIAEVQNFGFKRAYQELLLLCERY